MTDSRRGYWKAQKSDMLVDKAREPNSQLCSVSWPRGYPIYQSDKNALMLSAFTLFCFYYHPTVLILKYLYIEIKLSLRILVACYKANTMLVKMF